MAFLIVSILIFNIYVIFMPKRISGVEIYSAVIFAGLFNFLADVYLNLKLHLYNYFSPDVDWEYLLVGFGIFPAVNAIIANYFPYNSRIYIRTAYILGWSIFASTYESLSLKAGFYHHINWNIWYSTLCYPFIIAILIFNQYYVRYINRCK